MPTVLQSIRHLRRYRQVVAILTGYGFGYLLDQLGLGSFRIFRRIWAFVSPGYLCVAGHLVVTA